jgi:ABC-type oligopeptide transport system substrate-binding subunit
MQMSRKIVFVACIAVCGAPLLATGAAAHEETHEGELTVVVGFGTEPAYVGQPNSVQVLLAHGGQPVTKLDGELKVEVIYGDATTEYVLEPYSGSGGSGTTGDYRAWFVPSQPGAYTFHVFGNVEGEKIDQTITSGPKTFSEVLSLVDSSFPAVDTPSTDELATRIERESQRTQEAASAARSAQQAVLAAEDAASSAKTLGAVGVAMGAVALVVAIFGIVLARRSS